MNAEQKQYALDLVSSWTTARNQVAGTYVADKLAALLQEIANAPEPEPVATLRYASATRNGFCVEIHAPDIAEEGMKLYTAPPAPSVPDGLTTCKCRWKNKEQVQQCEIHHNWAIAIDEWADRAKLAEAKLAAPTPAESQTGLPFGGFIDANAPTPAEAPADVARWIDPNDKTQKQYLPHIGERVLFCHDGKTYYGKHTGGSFVSFTHPGNTYPTWECHWMYPPKAIDAAMSEKGQS